MPISSRRARRHPQRRRPADRVPRRRGVPAVLYAQREIDVAQHEQETAAALLTSVDDHVKAGLAVESDRMSAQVNVAARKAGIDCGPGRPGTGVGAVARGDGRTRISRHLS